MDEVLARELGVVGLYGHLRAFMTSFVITERACLRVGHEGVVACRFRVGQVGVGKWSLALW